MIETFRPFHLDKDFINELRELMQNPLSDRCVIVTSVGDLGRKIATVIQKTRTRSETYSRSSIKLGLLKMNV